MDVKLPNLGEGADSGVVVNVFVKAGDAITNGQPILELENEKAIAAIPSTTAGVVSALFVKVGDKVLVGQRLISVAVPGEAKPSAGKEAVPLPAPAARPGPEASSAGTAAPIVSGSELPAATEAPAGASPVAAPSIRRLAQELGIDLANVRGSQRGGRIVMADLKAYIQRLQARAAAMPARGQPAEPVDFAKWGPVTIHPLSPLRQVISRRMLESWSAVPRVTQFDEADVTEIMELRRKYASNYEQRGTRLTLTGFVLRAVVKLLQQHPIFNASLDETETNLVFKAYYHLGVAVDTDAGLIVPVIHNADKLTLVELSRALEDLARRARERKVTADELKGGTFTISNQGGIGSAHFTPIVNRPQVAILGLGRGALKPVWREDRVEPRTLLPLALSYDHRVIDGGAAARFMVDLVQGLEHFPEDFVRI